MKLEGTGAGAGKFIVATAHATHQVFTLSGYCNYCWLEPKSATPAISQSAQLGSAAVLTDNRRTSGSGARCSPGGGHCLLGLWICLRSFFLGGSYGICLVNRCVEDINPRPRACCVDRIRILNIPRVTEPRDNVLPLFGRDGILLRESIRQSRFVHEVSRVSLLIVEPE